MAYLEWTVMKCHLGNAVVIVVIPGLARETKGAAKVSSFDEDPVESN